MPGHCRIHQILPLLALLASTAAAQGRLADFRTPAERDALIAVMEAEDARAHRPEEMARLREALVHANPSMRLVAVRALGRLERDSVVGWIIPSLRDSSAAVRSAAAHALAQSGRAHPAARAAIEARLRDERDPAALAALAESLGRLTPADTAQLAATAIQLAGIARDGAHPKVLRGAARGFFQLARRQEARGAIPPMAVARFTELARRAPAASDTATWREIRMTAATAVIAAGALEGSLLEAVLADRSPAVREKAALGLRSHPDTALVRRLADRMLADPSPLVRFRAVDVYGRRLRATDGCAPLRRAAADADLHVSLYAIDALAGCRGDSSTVALLTSIAASLDTTGTRSWHAAAHAALSLAMLGADPEGARARVARLVSNPNPFVQAWGARVARRTRDVDALLRLARRPTPIVRAATVEALLAVRGHDADSVFIRMLETEDEDVVRLAAGALAGSTHPSAVEGLFAALDRTTAQGRETSRDARVALLDRIGELATSADSARLASYVGDFDPEVATRAARLLSRWTDRAVSPAPAPAPARRDSLPRFRDLLSLEGATARIELADGGVVALRLFPFDAPSNVWRFARLAESGWFDGLTFHRIAPFFVAQGGSPNANEYSGAAAFSRDELGRENRRGTVGLSTRGRDTGDGQLYINLIDNLSLDHEYTVWGEVIRGIEIVDRLQEGARIRRVVIDR